MKTGLELLRLLGKTAVDILIWVGKKLEGGK